MKIEPVLTPDNFAREHHSRFAAQRKTFLLCRHSTSTRQRQTRSMTTAAGKSDAALESLITAIKELIDEGVDVKLIMSESRRTTRSKRFASAGLTRSSSRRSGVHNKGMVVDSSVVVVGSSELVCSGRPQNRDASVIIHNAEAANTGSIFSITIGSTWPISRAWIEFLTRIRSRQRRA